MGVEYFDEMYKNQKLLEAAEKKLSGEQRKKFIEKITEIRKNRMAVDNAN